MFSRTGGQDVESSSSIEWPQQCRQLTYSEIQQATHNFDESLVIGHGGFGKVYKGTFTNGASIMTVAIKRLDTTSNQGAEEFWAEVKMLSNLRHCHLVSLIGYCNDEQEMILVYEYMSRGTLEDQIHKYETHLPWVQRLRICIGAARGLDYLHTGTGIKHGVVHRDVKSSNILLHNNWAAKISDFGLSRICPKNQPFTYVNTCVKGTFGYLDPDYFFTGKLTRKSDVYAFGVVLFEVLCGKRAVDRSLDEEHWGLVRWVQDSIKEGRLKQIVDTNIRGTLSSKCLKVFAHLANQCLHSHPKQRPTMAEVVIGLESILALQEKAEKLLQPAGMSIFRRKVPMVLVPSKGKSSVGEQKIVSLELFFDTVGGENQTLHRFDPDTLDVATGSFSEANKISQHTFDSLYKGRLQNGQGITIAGPSLGTRYKEYFMKEASILVKLAHENLAHLLGYCIEGTEVFLVYDFAMHTNLDRLLFDPVCPLLDWDMMYKIILGVARVLLYLHKHAPIQVIHCDVKPGNILLDESLDPVLTSFGRARCLEINETDCDMGATCGTWGYTAPECSSSSGRLSAKADVYSFGVLVLETLTRRRANMHILETNDSLEAYVKRKWSEGTSSTIIDPKINVDPSSLKRFIEIGLVCVQADAKGRPSMEEVVGMLLGSSSLTLLELKMRPRPMEERYKPKLNVQPWLHDNPPYIEWILTDDYDSSVLTDFLSELGPR